MLFRSVQLKIDKTKRLAEEDVDCYSLIYYAQSVIDNFPITLSEKETSLLQKKIEHLEKMNLDGTYEQNIAAYDDLDQFIDEFPLVDVFMRLNKAGEICDEHEPSKAPKFYAAVSNIMEALEKENIERVDAILEEILPEVVKVINQYDCETGTIQKGITR